MSEHGEKAVSAEHARRSRLYDYMTTPGPGRPEQAEGAARGKRGFAVLLGEFRRTAVLVPVDEDGAPLTADSGGVRWFYAFSDEGALARFAVARGEGAREWAYQRWLGARLLDAAVPAVGVPCGVALDCADGEDGMLFPPVRGGRLVGDTITLEHTYDPTGRLTTQSGTGAGGRRVQHRRYTYRADGTLTGIEDHLSGTRRFDLDATGRVTAVHAAGWTECYAYDEAGNQTEAAWPTTHPGAESTGPRTYTGTRITRVGNVRYEHDALGRITLRQKTRLSRKPDTWHYEWDAEDRLTSVVTPDGTRWRYTYDPLGRRTAKLRLAEDGETVLERVDFTWDGTTLCEQTTTSEALPHPITLTWDHQSLRPLAQTERITAAEAPQQEIDSRFFAIITDLIGTPTELLDEQGDIAWHTRSTLWGTTAWSTNSTTYTPLRFPGQYYAPETGLHYNYFRHYDPETARYLTPDPLGHSPAPNPDAYVDNPHTWADPLGLAPNEDCDEDSTHKRSSSRNAAFRKAKRDLGIPMSQQPEQIRIVPMTDRTGQQVMDTSHNPVMTR